MHCKKVGTMTKMIFIRIKNILLRKIARSLPAIFLFSCTTIPEDIFLKTYKPIFEKQGINFRIDYQYFSDRENITAYKNGSDWTITIHQGFLKHPAINRNGLKIAVCHEVGHLLGPKVNAALYADEYDSDEYAIVSCSSAMKMRKDEVLDGIESIYRWYRLYPVYDKKKYPTAQERKDIMVFSLNKNF